MRAAYPPSKPPSIDCEPDPGVFVPPFHYRHPITGDGRPTTRKKNPMRSLRIMMLGLFAALAATGCATRPAVADGALTSQIAPEIEAQLQAIGPVVAPPPTAALFAPLQQREPYAGVRVTRSIAYGPDPRHLLDVFVPADATAPRPVLVFVHGGAFTAGNRRTGDGPFYDNIMLWAVKHGMVGVNMTYRLAPQFTWPAAQEDIARALTWMRRDVASMGGDPGRIVLMGHSAGAAHVAQYIGHPRFHVAPGGGVAGAIIVSGLFDTTTAERNPPLQAYFGTDAGTYAERSALPGLVASKVPMLLAYAELDPADFQRQAVQARDALCKAGSCPPLIKLLGAQPHVGGLRDQHARAGPRRRDGAVHRSATLTRALRAMDARGFDTQQVATVARVQVWRGINRPSSNPMA